MPPEPFGVDVSRKKNVLVYALAAACVIGGLSARAEQGGVRAEIVHRDASVVAVDNLTDRSIRFESVAGRISLAYSQIKRIEISAGNPQEAIIETTAGDRWNAVLDLRPLERRLPLFHEEFDDIPASEILFYSRHAGEPSNILQTRINLKDGGILMVDGAGTMLEIVHQHGVCEAPLASADAFSFAVAGEDKMAAAWFRAERLFLRGKVEGDGLRTKDVFGNALTIPFDLIENVATRWPAEAAVGDEARSDATVAVQPEWADRETVRLRERDASESRTALVGTTVWSLDTAWGELRIPSPRVRKIVNNRNSGITVIHTVCGGRFAGRLASRQLMEWTEPGIRPLPRLVPEMVDYLDYRRAARAPGADWFALRLISGEVFYVRFADSVVDVAGRRRRDRATVATAGITAVKPHEETGLLMIRTATETHALHSRSRSVRFLLSANGARVELPWRQIESIHAAPIDSLPPSTAVTGERELEPDSVYVAGSEFRMGRLRGAGMADEIPPVTVRMTSFIMDATPVTRAQFAAFARATDYRTDAERRGLPNTWRNPGFPQRDADPVVFVSWYDAAHFCNWRSAQAGLNPGFEFSRSGEAVVMHRERNGFRLPTEAEWEYAARAGGRDVLYPWGDADDIETLVRSVVFRRSREHGAWPWTTPVKQHPPNPLGLYDMAGNVWEWCADWYFPRAYQTVFRLQRVNPMVSDGSLPDLTHRVMRGGSFRNEADMLRCASRGHGLPGESADRVGFRVVRNAPER